MKQVYLTIGYNFRDVSLIENAFTHSSYANEHNTKSNERLEFLGDSILGFVMSEYLYNYLADPEGKLSKLKAQLVSASTLKQVIDKLGLFDYVKLGSSLLKQTNTDFSSIKADLYEALLGAIYLDGGIDEAKKFIFRFLDVDSLIKDFLQNNIDYKTTLQELVQHNPQDKLSYKSCESDNEQFAFKSEVYINQQFMACGYGKSKKLAEIEAAKNCIQILNKKEN